MTQTPSFLESLGPHRYCHCMPATVRNVKMFTIHIHDHRYTMENKESLDNTIMRKGEESRIISPENNFNSFEYLSPSRIGSQQKPMRSQSF